MFKQSRIPFSGQPLDFATLRLLRDGRGVPQLQPLDMERVARARDVIDQALAQGCPIYGANTGVGAMTNTSWSPDTVEKFNVGLVQAHNFGTGDPFPVEVIRMAIAIRINTALIGRVGCSPDLVKAFAALLHHDLIPLVRRSGSIGCADIGLMGQIAGVLTGEGECFYKNQRMSADRALMQAGLEPIKMLPRDALAAFSLNAVGYASAAEALGTAACSLRLLLATGLTSAASIGAAKAPWKSAITVGVVGHAEIGKWLCETSADWPWDTSSKIQDPLSLRMMAQVFGSAIETYTFAGQTLLAATGRVDDNPVVIDGEVLASGGSLPLDVTIQIQAAQIALTHVARNVFNRCVILVNGGRRGLPTNLVSPTLVATGFGPMLKLAGDLFARVHSLSHPLSPQALVVANGLEDEASFLPLIVERFERQVQVLWRMAALEGILACQAIDVLGDTPRGVAATVYEVVRTNSPTYVHDRPLSNDVGAVSRR